MEYARVRGGIHTRSAERGLMSMHGCEPGCSSHSDTPTLWGALNTVHAVHCGVHTVHTVHNAVHTVTHLEPNTSTVPFLAKCNVQLREFS